MGFRILAALKSRHARRHLWLIFGSRIRVRWMQSCLHSPRWATVTTKADDIARVLEDEIVGGADPARHRAAAGAALGAVRRSAARRCARRCAGWRRSGSSRSSRTAASACARSRRRAARGVPRARRARGARDGGRDAADDAGRPRGARGGRAAVLGADARAARAGASGRARARPLFVEWMQGELRVPRGHLPRRRDAARRAAREGRAADVHRRPGLERPGGARRALCEERPAAPRHPRGDRGREPSGRPAARPRARARRRGG